MKATLKTKGRAGEINKRITVASNDPKTPQLVLTLKGEIVVEVDATPRYLSFGEIGRSENTVKELTLKVTEPDKIKISSVTTADARFAVEHKGASADGGDAYTVTFKGSKLIEQVSAEVEIAYTGGEASPLKIPLRASIVGDLRYNKSLYFLKRDNSFEPRDVVISTRSGKPVKIKGVEDKDKLLKIEIAERSGKEVRIKAEVADPAGNYKAPAQHDLVIKTSDADEPELTVRYTISEQRRPPGQRLNPKPLLPLGAAKRSPAKAPAAAAETEGME